MLVAGVAAASVRFELDGGMSFQSRYDYFDDKPTGDGVEWLTFDPLRVFSASSRLSIDVWKEQYRLGVTAGFLRRYSLTLHSESGNSRTTADAGEMLSIPVMGYIEGQSNGFLFDFGLGPYITRFNYTLDGLSQYSVTALFGFMFGCGYEYELSKSLRLVARCDLPLNAPVKVVRYLDGTLRRRIDASRFNVYNKNDFQSVIYNGVITLGIGYSFGSGLRLPLERVVHSISPGKDQ